jgi:adenylosuccinate synthase
MANELPEKPYAGVVDLTNQPNTYQGALRFAYLDHDLLAKTIQGDLADAKDTAVRVTVNLAVTCLDQVDEHARFWADGALQVKKPADQVMALRQHVLPVAHCSFGTTRERIVGPEA